jgi:hypothetical protein
MSAGLWMIVMCGHAPEFPKQFGIGDTLNLRYHQSRYKHKTYLLVIFVIVWEYMLAMAFDGNKYDC